MARPYIISVFVLMAPKYLKEFTLAIFSPSTLIDAIAFSSLVLYAFNFSSLILPA